MRLCTKHERSPVSGRWGRDGIRDDGGSVGYWRHGKSLDIFCRIREGGRRCCSRRRCETRRRCEMRRRRSSPCHAHRCERDTAHRGRPCEDRAARGLFRGAFLHGKPSGSGCGGCAAGRVASVGDVPVARLLREGAFAYLLVGFLLVYNVAASGWLAGIAVALRLLLLVWASLLLTALSTPAELSEALRRLLSPLGCLGLPVRDFTMSLSIALRFMPLLSEELRAVRAPQASRGAAFEGAGLVRRLRAYGGLMVPLFVGLFRRADRLASAMEARCYGASGVPTSLDGRPFRLWRRGGPPRRRCRLRCLRAYSLGACDKVAVVLVDYRNAARLRGIGRFARLRVLLALCPCRCQLAYQDGGENEDETDRHAPGDHLAVEQHAGQHAENRFQGQQKRPLGRRHVDEPHVLEEVAQPRGEHHEVEQVEGEFRREGRQVRRPAR